ncbi:MAG: S8 family serine peptidase [Bacteroidia bacterium]
MIHSGQTNKSVAWWDFVDNDSTVFREDDHGTNVMSTIGANLPGEMVGMAPHATFILARTEDAGSETKQEEHNWVAALEWADSIGVDVIHSSLGYSEFDQGIGDYTYDDMDGNTAVITRAADLAARKGIIVTTSAGNEGSGSWHYITAPCDGDSVLCAGAINKRYRPSSFSSWGPSSDGRVKPDVTALGSRTTVASRRNYITASDGTSFSGPLIGGLVTCLVQAHPDRSNIDIIEAVRMSGDQYNAPDDRFGYGVPDAAFADSLLSNVKNIAAAKIEGRTGENRPGGAPAEKKASAEKVIVFADNPQSTVTIDKKSIIISTPKMIRSFKLMRGEQEVVLNPKNVKEDANEVIIKKKYLLPGEDYYLNIKTGSYEENIKLVL